MRFDAVNAKVFCYLAAYSIKPVVLKGYRAADSGKCTVSISRDDCPQKCQKHIVLVFGGNMLSGDEIGQHGYFFPTYRFRSLAATYFWDHHSLSQRIGEREAQYFYLVVQIVNGRIVEVGQLKHYCFCFKHRLHACCNFTLFSAKIGFPQKPFLTYL